MYPNLNKKAFSRFPDLLLALYSLHEARRHSNVYANLFESFIAFRMLFSRGHSNGARRQDNCLAPWLNEGDATKGHERGTKLKVDLEI